MLSETECRSTSFDLDQNVHEPFPPRTEVGDVHSRFPGFLAMKIGRPEKGVNSHEKKRRSGKK
jgi:hypothetical protein